MKMMSNTESKTEKKILVLGATGKTGSRVMERLTQLGWPVQSGSRSATPKFDWEDRSTWAKALNNVTSVYVSFQPDLAVPGAVETIQQFSKTAVKNGVRKLVLLSGRGEVEAQQCEEAVMNAGSDWTIVRASWFNQNFSEGDFLAPILAGYVALPAGDVGEPFVDANDIADVAVAALTEEGHHGEVYEVTGPRLWTFKEAIQEIAKTTGRPILFEQVPMEAYASMLIQFGVPKEVISLVTYLFTEVLDGRNASLTNGVERALGRKPIDFKEYVRRTAATGVWNK